MARDRSSELVLGAPPDVHRSRKRWVVVGVAAALAGLALWALLVPLKSEAWGPCGDDTALTGSSVDEHCEEEARRRRTVAAITVVVAPAGAVFVRRWLLPADGSRPIRSKLLWLGIWVAVAGNAWLAFSSRVGGLQSNDVTIQMERRGEGTRILGSYASATQVLAAGIAIAVFGFLLARFSRRAAP